MDDLRGAVGEVVDVADELFAVVEGGGGFGEEGFVAADAVGVLVVVEVGGDFGHAIAH